MGSGTCYQLYGPPHQLYHSLLGEDTLSWVQVLVSCYQSHLLYFTTAFQVRTHTFMGSGTCQLLPVSLTILYHSLPGEDSHFHGFSDLLVVTRLTNYTTAFQVRTHFLGFRDLSPASPTIPQPSSRGHTFMGSGTCCQLCDQPHHQYHSLPAEKTLFGFRVFPVKY